MSLEGLQGYVLQVLAWLVWSTGSTTSFIALNRSAARGCTARVRSGSSDFPRGSVDSHAAGSPSDSAAVGGGRCEGLAEL